LSAKRQLRVFTVLRQIGGYLSCLGRDDSVGREGGAVASSRVTGVL